MIKKIQVFQTFVARFCHNILQMDFLIPLDPFPLLRNYMKLFRPWFY